jgi:hypothetical protein
MFPTFARPAVTLIPMKGVLAKTPERVPVKEIFFIMFPWTLVAVVVPTLKEIGRNLVPDTPIIE